MQCIKHDLGAERKQVKIITFSDVHIGSPRCDLIMLREYIDRVKNDDDCYAVIGGDLINNNTKTSVGNGIYSDELSPMDQMKLAISLFEPIKDKILGIVAGNHERRTMKDGTDLTYFFARQLGLEKYYDYASIVLFLRFGKLSCKYGGNGHDRKALYTIYLSHGDGQGGRTVGGKANGLERRGNIVSGCDVVITGHTHNMISFKENSFYIVKNNAIIKEQETTFVNSGSFLGYEDYADVYGMKPAVKGSPTIILSGEKKKQVNVIL